MHPIARYLVHNWRLKLSALGLAILLWALVQTEPREAQTVDGVPVVVDVADTAWTASGLPQPATVELRLSGPTGEIIRLSRSGTVLRVPVAHVGSSDTLVTLRRDWVELGAGSGLYVESDLYTGFLEPAAPTPGTKYQAIRGPLRYSFGNFKILPRSAEDMLEAQ